MTLNIQRLEGSLPPYDLKDLPLSKVLETLAIPQPRTSPSLKYSLKRALYSSKAKDYPELMWALFCVGVCMGAVEY